MKIKTVLPSKIRLVLKLLQRMIRDIINGNHSKFAKQRIQTSDFNYSINLVQEMKQTQLYEQKIENIKIAINKIEKVVVEPGEIFSFWKIIGEPSKKNGFKKGRNIVSGQVYEDYGGGLCQLSGIIYHLSLLGQLKILERYNHSMDIYTENTRYTPLGADATVVYGYKDFRIKNNYKIPIKFEFEINKQHLSATLLSTEKINAADITFEKKEKDNIVEVLTLKNGLELIGKSSYIKIIKK